MRNVEQESQRKVLTNFALSRIEKEKKNLCFVAFAIPCF